MYEYHYFEGAEGRLYCYAAKPVERCPYEDGPPPSLADHAAADALEGKRDVDLELVWRNAHRAKQHAPHGDGRCRGCGARLERIGFSAWIEEPWPDEDAAVKEARRRARAAGEDEDEAASLARTTHAINARLGNTHRRKPGSHRHFGLRREAKAWAVEESRIDKASTVAA